MPRKEIPAPMHPHEHLDKAEQLLADSERCMKSDPRTSGIQVGLAIGRTYLAQVSSATGTADTAVSPRTNEPPAVGRNEHGGVDTGALLARFRMLASEARVCDDGPARQRELFADAVRVAEQLDRELGLGAPLPQAWGEMQRPRD